MPLEYENLMEKFPIWHREKLRLSLRERIALRKQMEAEGELEENELDEILKLKPDNWVPPEDEDDLDGLSELRNSQ